MADCAEPVLNHHNHLLCLYPKRFNWGYYVVCVACVNIIIITSHELGTTQTLNYELSSVTFSKTGA